MADPKKDGGLGHTPSMSITDSVTEANNKIQYIRRKLTESQETTRQITTRIDELESTTAENIAEPAKRETLLQGISLRTVVFNPAKEQFILSRNFLETRAKHLKRLHRDRADRLAAEESLGLDLKEEIRKKAQLLSKFSVKDSLKPVVVREEPLKKIIEPVRPKAQLPEQVAQEEVVIPKASNSTSTPNEGGGY
jgi:hypothetical protein